MLGGGERCTVCFRIIAGRPLGLGAHVAPGYGAVAAVAEPGETLLRPHPIETKVINGIYRWL